MATSSSVSTAAQLGASLHDARIAAGLTQAKLAARARVSRELLIGIEQGSRPRAELGKMLDVMRTLDLVFNVQPRTGGRVDKKLSQDAADDLPGYDATEVTRRAVAAMRNRNNSSISRTQESTKR